METLEIFKLAVFAFFAIGVFYLSTKVKHKDNIHNLEKADD